MWRGAIVVAGSCILILTGCSRAANQPPATPVPQTDSRASGAARTGAVDTLSSEDLRGRHVADVAEMLQGRVPGLQVIRYGNGDISLQIRQSDSINSTGEPLVILDGAPVAPQNLSEVLRQLNPREVASIDVLRDVASTSVYGEKGAHGVIIITMKRK